MTQSSKKKNKSSPDYVNYDEEHELNFNDRQDGYGFGPPEYMDNKQPYEQDRRRIPEVPHDEFGLRNQYGPVDQYNFRDMYERRFSRPDYVEDIEDDWRDLDRKRYSNDDHSRMAGPDYRRPMDQRLTKGESNQPGYPGVSGKTIHGGSWFNQSRYQEQRKFVGKGPKGYHRSDDRIYEEVCEKLLHDPDVDASNIGVKVENGFVTLEGVVDSRRSKKLAEYLIDDLPGVNDVQNELSIDSDSFRGGPDEATKKDLGIGSQEGR